MPLKSKDRFIFPFSSLTGSRLTNFLYMSIVGGVSFRYLGRYVLSLIICIILEPFRWLNRILVKSPDKGQNQDNDPWFIIGFWRSGTTLMHQLISEDPRFFYVTTYQTIFPELMIYQRVLKWLAAFFVPDRRPVDNMRLTLDDAQEEEIALANITADSFYHFLYFPKRYSMIRDRSLFPGNYSPARLKRWHRRYSDIISGARRNIGGEVFLSKNPAQTFRIKEILDRYPNAKFIYLHRHPAEVLSSFRLFMQQVVRGVGFHRLSDQEFNAFMVDLYQQHHLAYARNRSLIPGNNLFEISFDDFIIDPLKSLEEIYARFGLDLSPATTTGIINRLSDSSGHQHGDYKIPDDIREIVENQLSEYQDMPGALREAAT